MRGMGWDGTGWQNCKGPPVQRVITGWLPPFDSSLRRDSAMDDTGSDTEGRSRWDPSRRYLRGKVTGCDDLRMAKLKGSKQMEGAKGQDLQILESSPGPNSGDLVRAYAP